MEKFTDLPISPKLLQGIIKKKYEEMTLVQARVIPLALTKVDVLVEAPTGTGKTMAFAIPILEKIDATKKLQAVILAPTRELVLQITKELKEVARFLDVKIVAIYGGEPIERQLKELKTNPQIIVATPGRLIDHLQRQTIKLEKINTFVLDEADEMLNMGFKEDIDFILTNVPQNIQTMLFSATISKEIEEIAKTYLKNPTTIKIKSELAKPKITQKYVLIEEKNKVEAIKRIVDFYNFKLVMVFCNTKKIVDEVTNALLTSGYQAEALHGDMKQSQREQVMKRFRSGFVNILVASDVAARGLDIDDVDVVINFDVPFDDEYYVHRIGRTGRANRSGLAVTFVMKNEKYRLKYLEKITKSQIELLRLPTLSEVLNARVNHIIFGSLAETVNPKYEKIIRKILLENEIDKDKLITNLLSSKLNNIDLNTEVIDLKEKAESENIRLFITLGKKDNISEGKIRDLLIRKANLRSKEINNIDVYDKFSFFDVPSKIAQTVIKKVHNTKEFGKKISVEVASKKKRG